MASPALIGRLLQGVAANAVIFGLLLFAPAGTVHWWRAWVLLGVIVVCATGTMFGVFLHDEALLQERMSSPLQKGQPLEDKIILVLFLISTLAAVVFIPLDVFRLHLLDPPPPALSALGLALFVAGQALISLTFRANTFAAPVVKHQAERAQKVIDAGPYRFVRHPMYAGAALLFIGLPLWLESFAATLAALVPIGLLAIRIVFVLRRHLPGYRGYISRVRWRLMPGLW